MEQSVEQQRAGPDTMDPSDSRQPSPTPSQSSCKSAQITNSNNSHHSNQNPQPASATANENQVASARKELESMVLRYARSEKEVIQNRNKIEELDRKLKRATKDNETLLAKVKALNNEKSALIGNLNSKIVHISQCEQDKERLRLDLSIKTERFDVVHKQFETEREAHQLTRKQFSQAKETIRRMQIKLDQQNSKSNNNKNHGSGKKIENINNCENTSDKNLNNDSSSQKGDPDGDGIKNANLPGHDSGQHDDDSAIFTNTTSDGDSLDHSNDKEDNNTDCNIESSVTTKDNDIVDGDDDDDETIEYDSTAPNDNTAIVTGINNNNNHKQTASTVATYSGPSLQEQQRVIELAKLERKIMELRHDNQDINNRLKSIEKLYQESERSLSRYKLNYENSESKLRILTEELDRLKVRLNEEEQKSSELQTKLSDAELCNVELEKQIESYKSKEGELLEFTERLSLKQAMLQSELNSAIQKVPQYEERFLKASRHSEEMARQKESLTKQVHKLKQDLTEEKKTVEILKREKESIESQLTKSIDELQNEIRVMKKKHINSTKELNKELKHLQSQLLAGKTADGTGNKRTGNEQSSEMMKSSSMSDTTSVRSANLTNSTATVVAHVVPDCASSIGSRTSSSTSLESASVIQNQQGQQHRVNVLGKDSVDLSSAPTHGTNSNDGSCKTLHDCDKSSLIDWVVKLQRHIVKRDERIDILQEQINQLIEEVKKKGHLLQHFILREESGLLSTDSMEKNKQQLAKRGSGIMSSLYSSSANDSGLTLELSLEINKKLQALLEDTILKNMTLKESVSTLGAEIARLNDSNEQQQ